LIDGRNPVPELKSPFIGIILGGEIRKIINDNPGIIHYNKG
jgi:hypothetical protein